MKPNDIAESMAKAAEEYLAEGHSAIKIVQSAMRDLAQIGTAQTAMSIMAGGKLSAAQTAYVERAGAKMLAALSMIGTPKPEVAKDEKPTPPA